MMPMIHFPTCAPKRRCRSSLTWHSIQFSVLIVCHTDTGNGPIEVR